VKFLSLALSRIGNYFRQQRLFFCIYLVGSIACILTFAYFLGNGVTYKVNSAQNDIAYRTYTLSFQNAVSVDRTLLHNICDDVGMIRVEAFLSSEDLNEDAENLTIHQDTYYITSYYPEAYSLNLKRGSYAPDQIGSIIVPGNLLKSGSSQEQITVQSHEYKITGENLDSSSFVVSIDDFSSEFAAYRITLLTHEILSENDSQILIEKLKQQLPTAEIEDPHRIVDKDKNESVSNIVYLSFMLLICLFTFSMLMQYMIEQNTKEIVVYSVVGANQRQIAGMLLLDNLMISGIAVIIAIILHIALYDTVFAAINIFDGLQYTWKDYSVLAILVLILSEIPMIPMIHKLHNHSTAQNLTNVR